MSPKLALLLLSLAASAQTLAPMRPPAVPLVAHDPYFSIWSMADRLHADGTKHWTGKPGSLTALVRVDGKTYRVMGRERQQTPVLDQTRLEVLPTRTIYEFSGAGVNLGLTFFTPALPEDLEVLSRPLTYIEWSISSADGREHDVALYFDAAADLVVNTPDQPVLASRYQLDGQPVLRMGSREQPVLAKRGDDLRIDWGYLYLAADKPDGVSQAAADRNQARAAFDTAGRLPDSDEFSEARRSPVLAFSIALGKTGSRPAARSTRAWPCWPIARRWPRTNWRPTPTARPCTSPTRTFSFGVQLEGICHNAGKPVEYGVVARKRA